MTNFEARLTIILGVYLDHYVHPYSTYQLDTLRTKARMAYSRYLGSVYYDVYRIVSEKCLLLRVNNISVASHFSVKQFRPVPARSAGLIQFSSTLCELKLQNYGIAW
jgi:hypothetical protein